MTQGKSTNKDAYTLILEAIDTGLYRPGDRLVESELADRLGSLVHLCARLCSVWKRNPCWRAMVEA